MSWLPILNALGTIFFLVILRRLLRREWLAAAVSVWYSSTTILGVATTAALGVWSWRNALGRPNSTP